MSAKPAYDPELLLAHSAWVSRLARSLAADFHNAEDLAQDVWVAALERHPRTDLPLRPWLARVLANLAGTTRRGERRRAEREARSARAEALPDTAEVVSRAAMHRDLVGAVLALDEPYRSTLLLRYLDGLSPRAIAVGQGIPVRTVHTRLARGLAQLRVTLHERHGDARAWLGAFLALQPRSWVPTTVLLGAATMKSKVAIVLAACLLLLVGAWKWLDGRNEPGEPAIGQSVPAALANGRRESEKRVPDAGAPIDRAAVASEPFVPPLAVASDPELELRGLVVTTAGEPIAGARVSVVLPLDRQVPGLAARYETLERAVAQTLSDSAGAFRLCLDPQRTYDLAVEAQGFARIKEPNLYAGEDVRVELPRAALLFGQVLDAEDDAPLAEVEILALFGTLRPPGGAEYRARTDAQGRYQLASLPSGFLQLHVEAPGHVKRYDDNTTLAEGEQRRLDLRLERGARLHGQVTDGATKKPIAQARVKLRVTDDRCAATADEDGRYVLEGVPLEYRDAIVISAAGYGCYDYPLQGVPKEGLEQDFFLLPERRARGRVVDRSGAAVAEAYVSARANRRDAVQQTDHLQARTDPEGRFTFGQLRVDLRHTLLIRSERHATAVFDFPAEEWSQTELDLGELVLEEPCAIAGRLLDSQQRPLPDLWVLLDGEPARRDSLKPSMTEGEGYCSGEGLGFGRTMARTDARGRYSFTDLPAGTFRLSGGNKGYARRANLELTLAEGEHPSDVDLMLDVGLSIEGTVVDREGRQVSRASVEVYSSSEFWNRLTYNICDEHGAFRLVGLEPGTYTLAAGPFGGDSAERFAEVRIEGVAAGVTGVRIVLPSADSISGTVLGPDSKPVPGALVHVPVPGGESVQAMKVAGTTDQDGRFTVWVAEGSSITLRASPPTGGPPGSFRFIYDEGGNVNNSYDVELEDVHAGTKDLVVRLPKLVGK